MKSGLKSILQPKCDKCIWKGMYNWSLAETKPEWEGSMKLIGLTIAKFLGVLRDS